MAFETLTSAGGVAWRRSVLLSRAGIPHAFSTRLGGVSGPPFDSLNLGLADASGEPDTWCNVQTNWSRLLQACGMTGRVLVRARQVHGVGVVQADRQADAVRAEPPFVDGDAIVTGDASQVVAVRVADCAPVLLADPAAGLVAAVHAGWRGVVAGVVSRAINTLRQRGADPSRLLAAIGPCIGPSAFEVGREVRDAMEAVGLESCVQPRAATAGKWLADLPRAIRMQLRAAGLSGERVDSSGLCTLCEPSTEFSYRRDTARSGRMAAIIGLPQVASNA